MNPQKPQTAQSRLLTAIDKLDEAAVFQALNDGAEVNRPDADGQAPLVRVLDHVLRLRESVFDPYPTGKPEETVVRGKVLSLMTLLLDKGANPDYRLDGSGDALVWATFANEEPIVRLLLERGASPDFLVDGDWFYDTAEMDFFDHMTNGEEPDDATDEELASAEGFLRYLERKNTERGGGFAPDVLKLLRQWKATSFHERHASTYQP